MDANERMPGDAEAAAAIAGMHETYGRRKPQHAVGDSLWFTPTVGSMPREGKVVEVRGALLVMQEPGGESHVISAAQIAEF